VPQLDAFKFTEMLYFYTIAVTGLLVFVTEVFPVIYNSFHGYANNGHTYLKQFSNRSVVAYALNFANISNFAVTLFSSNRHRVNMDWRNAYISTYPA
jgi:hypothetical protein